MLSPETLETVVNRGVSDIISRDEFIRLLQSGRPLRLKMGLRPQPSPTYTSAIRWASGSCGQLQDLGHQVILIVGDWTAQIGDPSGQSATRPMLTHEQVMENAQSYLRQFFKVVDRDRTQVVEQSEWFRQVHPSRRHRADGTLHGGPVPPALRLPPSGSPNSAP